MAKKILFEKKIDNYLVKYFLHEEKNNSNKNLFGVEIALFTGDGAAIPKTCKTIKKITQSKQLAIAMLNLMHEQDVTPNSLYYVVDQIYNLAKSKQNN